MRAALYPKSLTTQLSSFCHGLRHLDNSVRVAYSRGASAKRDRRRRAWPGGAGTAPAPLGSCGFRCRNPCASARAGVVGSGHAPLLGLRLSQMAVYSPQSSISGSRLYDPTHLRDKCRRGSIRSALIRHSLALLGGFRRSLAVEKSIKSMDQTLCPSFTRVGS